ncbi:hypothetical protein N799_05925 [Lysobacter arseniciresistens ZS79]|uniref:AsmA domain-containing protein n=1 Tax=Lysobacter arseniciresistens ZS79 TaxID=913325 RepID=A0A0A0F363_9GAMM|nr:hypothetical protein [Lysobacter arseniciresistens]KGM57591.1 hypothetical protein N799_05925 [Lysobacter arseniciresistens ZS79]
MLLALALTWLVQPPRVAGLVLDRTGAALGLEISASGISEYTLRGNPTLVVRDLVARQPGADTPVLRAGRVLLSLPWSTLRSRGAELTVDHVELDAPRLDLAALQRWRESRPPSGEVRIPTLTGGLEVTRGEVLGDGWSVDRIALQLPSLHPDRTVAGRIGGRFRNGDTTVPFDLQAVLTAPSMDAALGASGIATVVTPQWRLPMRTTFSGRLHDGDDALGLDGFRLGADAQRVADGRELPFVFGLAGPVRYRDGRFTVAPLGVALRGPGQGPVPDLDGLGRFAWDGGLSLGLEGTLAGWPQAWPSLPPPLDRADAPLPFALDYSGPASLSGPARLNLQRGVTAFDARFRLPDVLAWVDRIDTGTPLPPLDGTFSTPRLEIAGATLEGVEIEFSEDPADD